MTAKRVLLACDVGEPLTEDLDALLKTEEWESERHCYDALIALGYEVKTLAIFNDIRPFIECVADFKPDVIFNQVDHFNNLSLHDRNVAGVCELLNVAYTGSSPAALMLCKNKALTKELLTAHRIKVPQFTVFNLGKKVTMKRRLRFPQIIKPLSDEASYGIAKASLVMTSEEAIERVKYIHDQCKQDAIAEEYIEGTELYVSVLGNDRLEVFPIRQCSFPEEEGAPKFATFKVKWDEEYRKKWGIKYEFARLNDARLEKRVKQLAKRIYRILRLQGYGRLDVRLTAEGHVYVIEANPNPQIAKDEDYALSARKAGYSYEQLIARIVKYAEDIHPRLIGR
ncbi:MAG: ATP-grasp domain-containing protein [Candidatus Omnitrophica bacterium]|nr:ATP-grasp domain-containing protein [Candidatus Omnitrophota bacterium]